MINWTKTGRVVSPEGTTIIYTAAEDPDLVIESRKRHIKHANGSGTWDHTMYWVIADGEEVVEKYSLADAKQFAEGLR